MLEQLISSSELLESLQQEGINIKVSENDSLDNSNNYSIQITADTIELLEKACINLYDAISNGESKSFYGKAPVFTNFIDRIQGNSEKKVNTLVDVFNAFVTSDEPVKAKDLENLISYDQEGKGHKSLFDRLKWAGVSEKLDPTIKRRLYGNGEFIERLKMLEGANTEGLDYSQLIPSDLSLIKFLLSTDPIVGDDEYLRPLKLELAEFLVKIGAYSSISEAKEPIDKYISSISYDPDIKES